VSGDVEVRVRRNGQVIATIQRPLRELDGGPAVTYKSELWPLVNGSIEIGGEDPAAHQAVPEVRAVPPQREAVPLSQHSRELPIETEDLRTDSAAWQDDPVAAPPETRLIVDAGPGTGKTHAACARVAAMVNGGISATRVWLVSFTRTAVVEIRNRISRALDDPAEAASVRIITLDALAWAVQSGYSHDAKLTGSFDDNIDRARNLIRNDPDVREDLARVEHLIVDEAQDIIGRRADLVLSLIDALSPEAGVSVFADKAQAIYEFSESADGLGATNLLEKLEERGFRPLRLTEVHRTRDPKLLAIFTDLREVILTGGRRNLEQYVRSEIRRLAHADAGKVSDLRVMELPEDSLVLMRNRMDVLIASAYAGANPHRLRLSGLPICIRPWLAHLLWDYVQRRITRGEFEKRWHERDVHAPFGCEEAWQRCFEVAAESTQVLDLHRLRKALARLNPPMLFCTPEFGTTGPILGTIHASKGREAHTVYLYLQERVDADETGEESRVMFVGATRPRERLLVGTTGIHYGQNTNGRVWRRVGNKIQVEVGRPFDIEPSGLVGRPFFSRQEAALAAQGAWMTQPLRTGMAISIKESLGWQFTLSSGDEQLAGMSEGFRADLDRMGYQLQKRIMWLGHGRSLGLRTMVVATDSPALESMLEPWKSSGFLLAPLLSSLSLATLRSR
jgi:hypothetical protein